MWPVFVRGSACTSVAGVHSASYRTTPPTGMLKNVLEKRGATDLSLLRADRRPTPPAAYGPVPPMGARRPRA